MADRKSYVIVCDDLWISLLGKINLIGTYTQDIVISGQAVAVPQMVFYFVCETDKEDPFQSISLQVEFPGDAPRIMPVQFMPHPTVTDPTRNKIVLKQPFLIQNVILRPGRIKATVIDGGRAIDAGGIWITSLLTTSGH